VTKERSILGYMSEKIEVGVACIRREPGQFLIGKRSEERGGVWEFPGGKLEKGETILECIEREIEEEVGVQVSVSGPFLSSEMTGEDGRQYQLHFCLCTITAGVVESGTQSAREHQELRWATIEQISRLKFPEANREALTWLGATSVRS